MYYFPLDAYKIFIPISLAFSNFILMYQNFSKTILFDFHRSTWLCKFIFSAYFRKFSASGCQFLLLLLLFDPWSFSSFWNSYSINIWHFDFVFNDPWGSVHFFFNVSHQVLQVGRFLLIHFQDYSFSPLISILLLNSSTEFFILQFFF